MDHPTASPTVKLAAGEAQLRLDPLDGCRLTSLHVGDHELLSDGAAPSAHDGLGANIFGWGSFVMAPWAGRIRDGRATWGDRTLELDLRGDRHALHGLVHSRPWHQVADDAWRVEISGDEWFAPLDVTQRVAVASDHLRLDIEVSAPDAPAPATVGWHPWFVRHLDGGAPVHLDVPAAAMLARDADGMTTTRRAPVPAGSWDDAFVDLAGPVTLTWPDAVELRIASDAATTVVFTEPTTVVCVEPQSGPPDEVNLAAPRVVTAEQPLRLSTTWRWRRIAT